MASRLERALAQFRRRQRAAHKEEPKPGGSDPFRAVAEERLRHLEQQLGELKTRVNGLLFLVAGTVLTQVILKVVQ